MKTADARRCAPIEGPTSDIHERRARSEVLAHALRPEGRHCSLPVCSIAADALSPAAQLVLHAGAWRPSSAAARVSSSCAVVHLVHRYFLGARSADAHTPTQVPSGHAHARARAHARMRLRMAIRLLEGLRFRVRSEYFTVLGLPACGTHTETSHTHSSVISHRGHGTSLSLQRGGLCEAHII